MNLNIKIDLTNLIKIKYNVLNYLNNEFNLSLCYCLKTKKIQLIT